MPSYGRKYEPDPRDWDVRRLREFQAAAAQSWWKNLLCALFGWFCPEPPPPPPPGPGTASHWNDPVVLDQGQEGTCVGHCYAGWGDCEPVYDQYTHEDARRIYYEATCIDGACDSTYQNGSTMRSGAEAMRNRGKLTAYAFGTIADAKDWLSKDGPVCVGSDFTYGMESPDVNGVVSPDDGWVAGGHAYLMVGYDPATDLFEFVNSWGTGWGKDGHFFMTTKSLDTVLNGLMDPGELVMTLEVVG